MPDKNCPNCGTLLNADGSCPTGSCPLSSGAQGQKHRSSWPNTLLFAITLALIAAGVLYFLPYKVKAPVQPAYENSDAGIGEKLQEVASGDYEKELILAEGSTEAVDPKTPSDPAPGGVTWEELAYPGSERILNYLGRKLNDGERAFVTHDSYDKVKQYYSELIKGRFYKDPGMSEIKANDKIQVYLSNPTGSLTIAITKFPPDDKSSILITSMDKLSEGNLKPFGGPPPDKKPGGETPGQ